MEQDVKLWSDFLRTRFHPKTNVVLGKPWTSLYMDGTVVNFFLVICPHETGTWDPNYTPGVDIWTIFFIISKNSGQDLSNEGSNFILSSLEVGH